MADLKAIFGVTGAVAAIGLTGALGGWGHAGATQEPVATPGPRTLAPYPRHAIEDQVFYFVLPDRFADGNPANNQGDAADPMASGGFDPADKGMYHGGDIRGLTDKLDYIQRLGVTAIWLTPILKNKAVQGDSAGYHGYWTLDFTRLDPHLGSNAEMKAFIDAAHGRGIKVFFDIIVNHTADVIKYKECHQADGRHKEGLGSCDYKSRAQLAAGNGYTPFIPIGEEKAKVPGWLNHLTAYHNQGDSTWSGEDSLNGDFVGLDDVNTDKPEVVAGMIDIYRNLISEWRPDGFRLDTVKHVNPEFWQAFAPAVIKHARETAGIKDFTLFGEVFSADPRELSFYTTRARLPSVLDFAFQGAATSVVAGNGQVTALETLFDQDDRYNDADSSANQLVKFLGNHDVGRFGKFLTDGGTTGDAELLARTRLGNALMFFSRGVPVFYYGDEQGFTGDGGDKDAREDMFPSQVASFNDNDLIGTDATPADDNFDTHHPIYQSIAELGALYRAHPVLRRGIQMARPNGDESGKLLTFSRVDLAAGTEYLLAFNVSATDSKAVTLPAAAARYQNVHGHAEPVVADGQLSLTVPPMDFVILKAERLAPSPVATPTLAGVRDGDIVAGLLEVAVDAPELAGQALPQYQVLFEASQNGGDYQTLAVDNNAPYRLYWDTSALADGTAVKLRARMSNLVEPARVGELSFTVDARSPSVTLTYENANRLPTAWLYDADGSVMRLADAVPGDRRFSARFDWGKSASRTLVFANLGDGRQPAVVEKPLLLERSSIMKLARDDEGQLTAKLYLNSRGGLATSGNDSGQARERLALDDGGQAPLPAEVNLRGGLNGWGTTPLAYAGQGLYRGSALVKEGDVEYKFADANWAAINLGTPFTDTGLSSGGNAGNLKQRFAQTGKYDFSLLVARDARGRQYLLHAIAPDLGPFGQPLHLQGIFDGRDDWDSTGPMSFDGSGYSTELALTAGQHEFRLASADGSKVLIPGQLSQELALKRVADGKLVLTVTAAARYRFVVSQDAATKTYRLDVTPAAQGAAQGPYGTTEVLVRGEISGDTAMTPVGGGKYEALVVLDPANTAWGDDGVSAFKIADADWSAVNLGADGDGKVTLGEATPLAQGSDANLTLAADKGVYKLVLDAAEPKAPRLTLTAVAKDYLLVHYQRTEGDYAGWGLHAWGDIAKGHAPEWKTPIALSGRDAFGRFALVPMTAASRLGFIVHKGDEKNTPADLFFTPSGQHEIWIRQGDATLYDSLAAAQAAATK